MAKSARASVVKKNHRNLRATVFGPAHDARTARLSAKLQELAAKPKPETDKAMDVDHKSGGNAEEQSSHAHTEEMEIDARGPKMKPVKSASTKDKFNHKHHKISKRKKPRNSIVFPSEVARRKKMAGKRTKS